MDKESKKIILSFLIDLQTKLNDKLVHLEERANMLEVLAHNNSYKIKEAKYNIRDKLTNLIKAIDNDSEKTLKEEISLTKEKK